MKLTARETRMSLRVKTMKLAALIVVYWAFIESGAAQVSSLTDAERGAKTARGGFRNEDEVRDRFRQWKTDRVAQRWLAAMGYSLSEIRSVHATKPHGHKADVEVIIDRSTERTVEGISIKLVSGSNGFNQIDKRWLAAYADMWEMPAEVRQALQLYVGEVRPNDFSRRRERMYLDELTPAARDSVVEFFQHNRERVVSDLFEGAGDHAANWFMVIHRGGGKPRWTIKPMSEAIRFYAVGPVKLTRAGNLKIGRISMQRKGGDNGRRSAQMLQFKINPALLLSESQTR